MEKIQILAFVGSRRKNSYNRALADYIRSILPDDVEWNEYPIFDLPFYDEDLEDAELVARVRDFQKQIAECDAIAIVSPEYNYSIPAVVKNAIDWGSRPIPGQPIVGKPAIVAGTSVGPVGTTRMQLALQQVFAYTRNDTLTLPGLIVPRAKEKFDAQGRLIDEQAAQTIRTSIEGAIAVLRKRLSSA